MKIKVCGMKIPENIENFTKLDINFMGFIFYPKSKRYTNKVPVEIPENIKKVGVFVNKNLELLIKIVRENKLEYVQLHGNETIEYCKKISQKKIKIIKAFSVDDNFDFKITCRYQSFCDYFVFDTKGKNYGGNGIKFNWEIIENYKGETPFLLSGGISPKDLDAIKDYKHKMFTGIDINSGFEIEPGIKNILEIEKFIEKI